MSYKIETAIVGGGAAGLIAALKAHENGREVVVFERDSIPQGSTALSAGLIPAANTMLQKQAGIDDNAEIFCNDILKKAENEPDAQFVRHITETSGQVIDWLNQKYNMPFSVVENFNYPGHSRQRMHGLPSRSGLELINRLREEVEKQGITIINNSPVLKLIHINNQIEAIVTKEETIECDTLILCCNGYGGNAELVSKHIPEMAGALYFGHNGNKGDALIWGEELGVEAGFLSGYQGHGSVATPHNILITWATIMEGGFQVNSAGNRFHDETKGYSEAACEVLRQDNGIAYTIFDARIADICHQFDDFKQAEKQGAIITAPSLEALAQTLKIPFENLQKARTSRNTSLNAPFCAVKVTGALFHTQGGLKVNNQARVLPFENLYAAGGAAAGVSGSKAGGYLSGNGLLTAVTLGAIAGGY